MNQPTLFPEYDIQPSGAEPACKSKSRQETLNDYDGFVEKFQPKLTTDDCYTPPAVYDVVLDWVRKNCDIEGCNIVRPFYQGGDYQATEYGENDVVVDNPPFSIITKIVRWYTERGIRFFLFAPYLTILSPGRFCTSIVCDIEVIYQNGAKVNTGFVSNMLGDVAVMTAPDLREAIIAVQKSDTPPLPKYSYPMNVIRATDMGIFARQGIDLRIPKSEVRYITQLDLQKGKTIFGGGFRPSSSRPSSSRESRPGRGHQMGTIREGTEDYRRIEIKKRQSRRITPYDWPCKGKIFFISIAKWRIAVYWIESYRPRPMFLKSPRRM